MSTIFEETSAREVGITVAEWKELNMMLADIDKMRDTINSSVFSDSAMASYVERDLLYAADRLYKYLYPEPTNGVG